MKTKMFPIALLLAALFWNRAAALAQEETAPVVAMQTASEPSSTTGILPSGYGPGVGGGDSQSHIICFTPRDGRTLDMLAEDLGVMSILLERKLVEKLGVDLHDYRMGIPMLLSSGSRKVRGLYLEGFGALFTLCVGFPLTAPPGVAAEPTEESSNPEWDQARKELHGEITPEDQANPYVWSSSGFAQVLYDAAKVDALNMQLLHTLKQASNVRNLKPDESVAVVVFGPVGAPSAESPKRPGAGRQQAGTRPTSRSTGVARNAAPGMNYQMMMRYGLVSPNTAGGYGVSASDSGTTTLSLRATKADVDAFALGKLGLEEFRQKVSLRIGGGDVPAQTPPGASPRPAVRSTR